jgi:hypothetical protein
MMTTTTFTHHPDIQAALEVYAKAAPGPAEQAHRSLQLFLRDLYEESDKTIAWHTSTLTGDGFPLEFVFTPADNDIRYTVEMGSSLVAPVERLELACQRLQQLGQTAMPIPLVTRLRRIQQGYPLHYGGWVGGRHGLEGDSYKLYLEVPAAPPEAIQSVLTAFKIPAPRLANRQALLRIVGYNLASRRLEAYFRVSQAEVYHLPRLMEPCGLRDFAQELQEFLAQHYGYPLPDKLPGGSIGFSYSLSPEGEPQVFTLFLFARIFWGGDANIRRRFSDLATQQGWDASRYLRITQSLATRQTWTTAHGLLGFSVSRQTPITLSIGVRPQG